MKIKHILYYSMTVATAAALMILPASTANAKGRMASTFSKPQVVYTGEIAKKIIGYNGPTPLNITISGGKITNIEALPNNETPKYFNRAAEKIFPQYIGKTIEQAIALKPDIATGATYSSKAIIENIRTGLQQSKPAKQAKPANGKRRMTRK